MTGSAFEIDGSPYAGLRAYDSGLADQHRFHGRDHESDEAAALWRSNRLLVLYGPSGVGKTSLLQAGVIPRLSRETADTLPVGRLSHSSGFPATAQNGHNPYTFALLSSWCPDRPPAELAALSVTEFLTQRPQRTDRYKDPLPVLGAIDQFEELFIDVAHRRHYFDEFLDQLASALEDVPGMRLLIAIRKDSLVHLIPHEVRLAGHSRTRFEVLPLTCDAALQAVAGPLERTVRSFAPNVAEELVDKLRNIETPDDFGKTKTVTVDFVEPTRLQVACFALWRALPDEVTTITEKHLHQYAKIWSVREFCTKIISEVASEHASQEWRLYDWLERIFLTRFGSLRPVYEGVSQTGGMPNSIARALVDRGILKSGQRFRSRWYELQHEQLIAPIRQANRAHTPDWSGQTSPAEHYLRTAETLLATGEPELAQAQAEEALLRCGDHDGWTRAEAESFLGTVASQTDRPREAEHHFLRAAQYFETLGDKAAVGQVLADIGRLLLTLPPYADAVSILQAAVSTHPDDVTIQTELARALWYSGDLRAAAAVYGGILSIAPTSAEALAGRGQILVELNDDASALDDIDHFFTLQEPDMSRWAEVRAARALALAQLGKITEAVSDADTALANAPSSGPVLLRAARVKRVAGEPARATELLRRAHQAQSPPLLPHQRDEVNRLLAEAA